MPEVKMPKTRKTAAIIICAGIAIPLALATALRAQEPGAAKGEAPAPLPSPAEVAGSPACFNSSSSEAVTDRSSSTMRIMIGVARRFAHS